MKKAYEAPKVEKMAFDYSDVVVASKDICRDIVNKTDVHVEGGPLCDTTPVYGEAGAVGT